MAQQPKRTDKPNILVIPPRQKAASFTIDQAMEKMEASLSGAQH
jgi:hypothetical protein